MRINTFLPAKILSPFINNYLIIESEVELINRVLPDTSLVMAFRYKGNINYLINDKKKELCASVITGVRKSKRLINYSRDTVNILVIFKEGGANAFIKEPLYELFGSSIALRKFDDYNNLSIIEERIAEQQNHVQRISIIEQFLVSKLNIYKQDKLVLTAIKKIKLVNGIIKIKKLADLLHISIDALEKRFRKVVGISPKQFSYIVRMRSVIDNGFKTKTLAETAVNAGYYDQSHFNKDFKLFTGQTPTDFLKSPVFW